jgi:dihydroorotate dehydrogenase (NAD+) catalytic subunit
MGGLSGPAIKPVGIRMVYQAAKEVGIPIIGLGGIMTGEDAIEYLMAGASAIAVGTANLVNPSATMEVLQGIIDYMNLYGVTDIKDLVGVIA